MIAIETVSDGEPYAFAITLGEGRGQTSHRVTLNRGLWQRLTEGKATPQQCVEAAFRFLLDREPKEAILERFDMAVIARYFPEFEREFPRYLVK
jgi:hypothetical protein